MDAWLLKRLLDTAADRSDVQRNERLLPVPEFGESSLWNNFRHYTVLRSTLVCRVQNSMICDWPLGPPLLIFMVLLSSKIRGNL